METVLLILGLVYVPVVFYSLYLYTTAIKLKSYEVATKAIYWMFFALIIQLAKLGLYAVDNSFSSTMAVFCIVMNILSITFYSTTRSRFTPKISEAQRQALENKKIIDELNKTYLGTSKVVDKD